MGFDKTIGSFDMRFINPSIENYKNHTDTQYIHMYIQYMQTHSTYVHV